MATAFKHHRWTQKVVTVAVLMLVRKVDCSPSAQQVHATHGPPTPKPKTGLAGKEPIHYIRHDPIAPERLRDPQTSRFLFFDEVIAPLFRVGDILSDLTADEYEIDQPAATLSSSAPHPVESSPFAAPPSTAVPKAALTPRHQEQNRFLFRQFTR